MQLLMCDQNSCWPDGNNECVFCGNDMTRWIMPSDVSYLDMFQQRVPDWTAGDLPKCVFRIHKALSIILRCMRQIPSNEKLFQFGIAFELEKRKLKFSREVKAGSGFVDFVINSTAIEVKTKGTGAQVERQIVQYLQDDKFDSGIIVTTKGMEFTIDAAPTPDGDKPILNISLWKLAL